MSETSLVADGRKPRPSAFDLFCAATVGLLVLNFVLLWTGSYGLPTGVPIFYWQRFSGVLYQLRCWGVIAAPICVAIWWVAFFRRRRKPEAFVVLLAAVCLLGACLCVNYLAVFTLGSVDNADSIAFNGRTYQLAEFFQYDDPEQLYLGECDASGLRCIFWEIYQVFWLPPGRSPHLARSWDGSALFLELGDSVVYSYDGIRGHCISRDFGQCVLSSP